MERIFSTWEDLWFFGRWDEFQDSSMFLMTHMASGAKLSKRKAPYF